MCRSTRKRVTYRLSRKVVPKLYEQITVVRGTSGGLDTPDWITAKEERPQTVLPVGVRIRIV